MNQNVKSINAQLHELEDQLIQLQGLVQALQQFQTDDSATICLTNAIQEQLNTVQKYFYMQWEMVVDEWPKKNVTIL